MKTKLWNVTCENKALGTKKFRIQGMTRGRAINAFRMASMAHRIDLRGIAVSPGDLNSKTSGFTVEDIVEIK